MSVTVRAAATSRLCRRRKSEVNGDENQGNSKLDEGVWSARSRVEVDCRRQRARGVARCARSKFISGTATTFSWKIPLFGY